MYASRAECCELLLNRGANINGDKPPPLIIASRRGDERICKVLINKGADVNACTDDGFTCLHSAALMNRISIAKIFLAAGARTDMEGWNGETPLDIARNHSKEIASLIENHIITINLSGVISRGLDDYSPFSDFLIHKIDDPRLFLIVTQFAYN